MPILYYTTTINAHKTISEVQQHLAEVGAKRVGVDYDAEKNPEALLFVIEKAGQPVSYRLPCNWPGMFRAMLDDDNVPNKYCNEDQAMRTGWRIIKVWVEAQTAMIHAGLAESQEVFLPYAIGHDGRTVWEYFAETPRKLLE